MLTVKVIKTTTYEVTMGEEVRILTPRKYKEFYDDFLRIPEPEIDSEEELDDVKIYPQPEGMPKAALDPEETEQEEIHSLATNEPEAQGNSDTEVVEEFADSVKEALKAKGMVEKPEWQGKEPAILEPTPKEPKAKHDWTKHDLTKYIEMKVEDKVVIEALMQDFRIAKPTAYNVFRRYVKGKSLNKPVRVIKTPEVTTEAKSVPISHTHLLEIANMPDYLNLKQLKNAICDKPHFNDYLLNDIKVLYMDTHPEVRW